MRLNPLCLKYFLVITLLIISLFVIYIIKSNIKLQNSAKVINKNVPLDKEINNFIKCNNRELVFSFESNGQYLVLNNFIKATREFNCDESITLTTPGDYRFLDNVPKLVDVWQGPISVALYAPGYDFLTTLDSIAYLRSCTSFRVKEFVTFHLFFEYQYINRSDNALLTEYMDQYDCNLHPPYQQVAEDQMFKTLNKLPFPLNVARNIARKNVQTHFIFALDIELFPTPNFISKFLQFVNDNSEQFQNNSRRVFVLPIFEVLANQTIPENKTMLQEMLINKQAFLFHEKFCKICHLVIEGEQWIKQNETNDKLNIFAIGKRQGKFKMWEPFYVSDNREPYFDERFNWEGQRDKHVQSFTMCLLNYDFAILDNAFLVHKPGVKKLKDKQQFKYKKETLATIELEKNVHEELKALLGDRTECYS